jgi:hypothetical protein
MPNQQSGVDQQGCSYGWTRHHVSSSLMYLAAFWFSQETLLKAIALLAAPPCHRHTWRCSWPTMYVSPVVADRCCDEHGVCAAASSTALSPSMPSAHSISTSWTALSPGGAPREDSSPVAAAYRNSAIPPTTESVEFESLRQVQFLSTVLPDDDKALALADSPGSSGEVSSASDEVNPADTSACVV